MNQCNSKENTKPSPKVLKKLLWGTPTPPLIVSVFFLKFSGVLLISSWPNLRAASSVNSNFPTVAAIEIYNRGLTIITLRSAKGKGDIRNLEEGNIKRWNRKGGLVSYHQQIELESWIEPRIWTTFPSCESSWNPFVTPMKIYDGGCDKQRAYTRFKSMFVL